MSKPYYDKSIDINLNQTLIERDKKAYEELFAKWIKDNLNQISERRASIENVGAIFSDGYFINLLKEAELNFVLGAYHSSISLIYILIEDFCKILAKNSNIAEDSHFKRIGSLYDSGILNESEKGYLNEIRTKRNDIWHSNGHFASITDKKHYALDIINKTKNHLSNIVARAFPSQKNQELSISNENLLEEIVKDMLTIDSFGSTLNEEELTMKIRNITNDELGINIAPYLGNETIIKSGFYYIDEVDLNVLPKEVTVIDLLSSFTFFIDLENSEQIQKFKDSEGKLFIGTIYSQTSPRGQTEKWVIHENFSYNIVEMQTDLNVFKERNKK